MVKSPVKRGRPPKDKSTMLNPITVRFPAQMMDEIERLAAQRMDQPDKSQIVRELVAKGIEALRAEKQKK